MDAEAEVDNSEAMSTDISEEGDNSVVPTALSGVRVEYSFAVEGYTQHTEYSPRCRTSTGSNSTKT
jgi:hypothetical protein